MSGRVAGFILATILGVSAQPAQGEGFAHVFAPGVISGPDSDIAPAFGPSGKTLYFSRRTGTRFAVLESTKLNGAWSAPHVANFSGRWNDLEAAMAPSGKYIIFASDRPAPGETSALTTRYYNKEQDGGRLWRVDVSRGEAGAPYLLPSAINTGGSVWTPSIAANNDLYFMHTDPKTGRFRLMVARARSGRAYMAPKPLTFSTGASNDVDPVVDPRQRFLIFSSDRASRPAANAAGPERLFVAFAPGSADPVVCAIHIAGWTDPEESQVESRLSPDGQFLYFASRHPDHAPGQPAAGNWDNGKPNIWVVPIHPLLAKKAGHCGGMRTQER